MKVTISLGPPLRGMVGQKRVVLELGEAQHSVTDVLEQLAQRYPLLHAELQPDADEFVPYSLFLNRELVRWGQVAQTHVSDGDELSIFMPIAGG
ncbi:MAG: MoaD/ThiS family protein [Anaerolineae bacterium]